MKHHQHLKLQDCHKSSLNIRSSIFSLLISVADISTWPSLVGVEKSLLAREKGSCLMHRSNCSLMGVGGLEASLDLWMGTLTGREVASRKLVWRVLLTISEWIGRKSGREHERDDFLDEDVEEAVEFEIVEW